MSESKNYQKFYNVENYLSSLRREKKVFKEQEKQLTKELLFKNLNYFRKKKKIWDDFIFPLEIPIKYLQFLKYKESDLIKAFKEDLILFNEAKDDNRVISATIRLMPGIFATADLKGESDCSKVLPLIKEKLKNVSSPKIGCIHFKAKYIFIKLDENRENVVYKEPKMNIFDDYIEFK